MAAVSIMPLEAWLPQIGGFGIMYLLFAVQAAYLFSQRPECVRRVWQHPVFVTVYIFLSFGYLREFGHSNSDYYEIFRILQNFVGAVFLASLCRDRKALQSAMYGYLIVGVYTSYVLFGSSYSALSGATAFDYGDGDRLRAQVFEENPLETNLNALAFFAAQGAGVAMALALTCTSTFRRYAFLGVGLACIVGSFLPMSRGGVIILAGICATVMLGYGLNRGKTIAVGLLLVAALAIWVPKAVFSRLAFSTETDEYGRMEGRAALYTAFFHHLPEVALTGVGRGNFWGQWGKQSSYGNSKGLVSGAHNIFFQLTLYWGLPAAFGLLAICWQAYRCLPGRYGDDGLAIAILCIGVSLLLWSMQVHNLYDKAFALGLGLLVGAHRWIWSPAPAVPMPQRARNSFRPVPRHA
jgi:hypothetical protein